MIRGQGKGLVRSTQGLAEVDTGRNGYVIFSVKHGRPGVEEKANAYMDFDLREADRWDRKAKG